MSRTEITAGDTYAVRFPFVRTSVVLFDEEGSHEVDTWRPGTHVETIGPDEGWYVANGEGWMLLHVVDVHRPGKYPKRVFFTRKWRDPDGVEFGKNGLRIMTEQAFRRRAAGYMHGYEVRARSRSLPSHQTTAEC